MTDLHEMQPRENGRLVCIRCGRAVRAYDGAVMDTGDGSCAPRETAATVARWGREVLARQVKQEERN